MNKQEKFKKIVVEEATRSFFVKMFSCENKSIFNEIVDYFKRIGEKIKIKGNNLYVENSKIKHLAELLRDLPKSYKQQIIFNNVIQDIIKTRPKRKFPDSAYDEIIRCINCDKKYTAVKSTAREDPELFCSRRCEKEAEKGGAS